VRGEKRKGEEGGTGGKKKKGHEGGRVGVARIGEGGEGWWEGVRREEGGRLAGAFIWR